MKSRLSVILLIILLAACSGLNRISLFNLSNLYENTGFTELQCVAFNKGDQTAIIYVQVQMADFVIAHDKVSDRNLRKALVKYRLFDNYESKNILDSAGILIYDSTLKLFDTILEMEIDYPGRKKYILSLELTDLNRVDVVKQYLWLDNTGPSSHDNYIIKDHEGEILFSNILDEGGDFYIELSDKEKERLFVRYYHRDYPLALPPFLEETETNFDYRADSVFAIEVNGGRTGILHFPEEGFYHFQADSNLRGGYTVFRFGRGFPEIHTTDQMLQPLRYITARDEFEEIQNAEDVKLALDNFWLNNAGNAMRARAMIQKYYGRVVDANKYFTSYHEGWKTDRGLIYIVYGPPKIVYRGNNVEEWLYGEKGNNNSIHLKFVKVINPFSENDYSLIKSPSYREKWYNIVNTWRR